MKELPIRYGFPLFSTTRKTSTLLKLERNRVSDIWSLLDYIIKQHLRRNGRSTEVFLSSLHDQAKYFYKAAENAPIRSQPLLYYYSFLNLTKIYLCLTEGLDSSKVYQHGIKTTVNATTSLETAQVEVQSLNGSTHVSVAHRLMSSFGDNVNATAPTLLMIKECLGSCVGIHRTFCETYDCDETFIRLNNIKCTQLGQVLYFVAELNRCTLKKMTDLTTMGYNVERDGEKFSVKEIYNMPDYTLRKQTWVDFSSLLKQKGLWSYTDGDEYRMFVSSSQKLMLSSSSIIYSIMFFLGSVTRYNPYFFDTLMDAKEQWLISEFLNTQPKQFLYYLVSTIVGKPVYQSRAINL